MGTRLVYAKSKCQIFSNPHAAYGYVTFVYIRSFALQLKSVNALLKKFSLHWHNVSYLTRAYYRLRELVFAHLTCQSIGVAILSVDQQLLIVFFYSIDLVSYHAGFMVAGETIIE